MARGDTGLQQPPHGAAGNVQHLAAVMGGNLRRAAGFGQDQARCRGNVRIGHGGQQHADQAAQGGFRIAGRADGDQLFSRPGQLAGRLLDQRIQHGILGREVEIDGTLGEAGAFRDVLDAGLGKALFTEHGEGGIQDFIGSGFGAAFASGLGHERVITDRSVSNKAESGSRNFWEVVAETA